jgi:NitT/TauT family transport system substrate-binding protein
MRQHQLITAAILAVASFAMAGSVLAQDAFKVAVGQIDIWRGDAPVLGQKAGIFKKHGIDLEVFGTAGAGETLQAIIAGSADFGINVGAAGVMRAYAKGAPIRIIGADFTGAGDVYWYVKADSPIKSLKDATDKTTIAYSTNGSTTHNVVLGFGKELGSRAIPTSTGGMPATLTAVMSGQIDIGWGSPPFGIKQIGEGQIRVIANGNDVPSLRDQTIAVDVVNANVLRDRPAAAAHFIVALRETLDWMYSDPAAMQMYADMIGMPVDVVKAAIDKYQPKEAKQFDHILDVDGMMADAVRNKFLDAALTKEQLSDLIQITPPQIPQPPPCGPAGPGSHAC